MRLTAASRSGVARRSRVSRRESSSATRSSRLRRSPALEGTEKSLRWLSRPRWIHAFQSSRERRREVSWSWREASSSSRVARRRLSPFSPRDSSRSGTSLVRRGGSLSQPSEERARSWRSRAAALRTGMMAPSRWSSHAEAAGWVVWRKWRMEPGRTREGSAVISSGWRRDSVAPGVRWAMSHAAAKSSGMTAWRSEARSASRRPHHFSPSGVTSTMRPRATARWPRERRASRSGDGVERPSAKSRRSSWIWRSRFS